MSREKPEVGDVWVNKTGRLRVYITKVDVWGIIGISSSGAVVSKNMYHLEKYTYIGKSKVNIKMLFDVKKEENEKDKLADDLKQIVRDSVKQAREIIDNWNKGVV